MPKALFAAVKSSTLGRGKGEFLQQQLEVATEPHVDMAKARAELRQLRHMVAGIVAPYGLGILAAGTHPTAAWSEAQQTKAERYDTVMHDLQMIGRRNMLCGMHVHVELPDPDARVDVMTRMLPYLPIFIALATSSPFWQSQRTGLLGYRLAAYDELPRTGAPELFRTHRGIRILCRRAGPRRRDARRELHLVGDAAVDRASDAGIARTRLLHAAGGYGGDRRALPHPGAPRLFQSLAQCQSYRRVARHHRGEQVAGAALRHSRDLLDEARPRGVPFARWLDQVIEEAADDAVALGCLDEVLRCRAIVADGTSADAQLEVYRQARDKGAERKEALAAVSQWLAETTLGRDDPGQHLRPRTSYLRPPAAGIDPEEPSCTFHAPRKRRVHRDRDLTPDMPALPSSLKSARQAGPVSSSPKGHSGA